MMKSICSRMVALSFITLMAGGSSVVNAQELVAVSNQPQPTELLSRGQDKAKRGDYRGAIADYTLALQVNPKLAKAYIQRGLAHHDMGEFKQAMIDFDQAVQLEPTNAVAIYNRGEIRVDIEICQGRSPIPIEPFS